MSNLQGKWALVTGASRGVGKHIATSLAGLGCNIILHSRSIEHTAGLAASLAATGASVIAVAAELDDQNQVDAMLDDILARTPQVDIVFNNAAVMAPWRGNPWDTTAEDFRKSFEVNVISIVRICNRLVPLMLQRKWGRVVNLTSGIADQPQLMAYSISKAALDKYVRDFAPTLSNSGVMMNLLDPGWLRTDMGGSNAPNDPSTVIPGALVPALLDDGISGRFFRAQDYAGKSITEALTLTTAVQR
ncbi:MAG: SDR family NAD(P)-dependent oxidoreductase [Chloroflexi bacterium]|nr:SDR family NAD(P)-dependent oxidoreductase [Chloroflexota bacterium]